MGAAGYNGPVSSGRINLASDLDSDLGRANGDLGDLVERTFQMTRLVRHEYGMTRLKLGALLDMVSEHELWRGKAASFWGYVDDLRLNRNACRSYIRVARKFVVELSVSDAILAQLAGCNMAVLEKAASVITPDNAEEVISVVLALHQRDALAALEDFDTSFAGRAEADDVSRVFNKYLELTDDRRIEFLNRLRGKEGGRQERGREAATPRIDERPGRGSECMGTSD